MMFSITTTMQAENGAPVHFHFETDVTSIEDLHRVLVEDGCLIGTRHTLRRQSDGFVKHLEARVIVGLSGIVTVTVASQKAVDDIEDARSYREARRQARAINQENA